jgi:hypothetical protein
MLCDTFTVEMLIVGVPSAKLSILLGHSSARITEKGITHLGRVPTRPIGKGCDVGIAVAAYM